MMPVTPNQTRRHAAYSLLETVLSLTVLAVAFAAVGSVFVLAAKVMPDPGSAEAAGVDQSRVLSRMIEDLEAARYITGGSANSITFVVDDRTGDGLPERITYAWSGIAGDPLTYTMNGSAPVTVAEDVQRFVLSATTETRTDMVPVVSEVSDEQAWYSETSAASTAPASVSEPVWVGQVVRPSLPNGVASYTVSRVRFRAMLNGEDTGRMRLTVRPFDLDASTLGAAEVVFDLREDTFDKSFTWEEVVFDTPVPLDPTKAAAVTMEWAQDGIAGDFEYDNAGGSGLLMTEDGGASWRLGRSKGMLMEVFGRSTISMPGVELRRTVVTRVGVKLKIGAGTVQTVTARLYREPGLHSAVWDAGFDASPATLDLDGNGADWAFHSGGASSAFSEGCWKVDGVLYTQPTHAFDEPLVVDLVMGATAAGRSGAVFQINADQSGGEAVPLTVRAGLDGDGQFCVRVYDAEALDRPRLDVAGLGANPPRVRLLVVPADNAVGVLINGQPAGSFTYDTVSAGGLPGLARMSEATDGFFDEVTIRVGASAVVTTPAGQETDSGTADGDGLVGGLINGLLGR